MELNVDGREEMWEDKFELKNLLEDIIYKKKSEEKKKKNMGWENRGKDKRWMLIELKG